MFRRTATKVVLGLIIVLSGVSISQAAQKATLVNNSSLPARLFLKWSHLPYESSQIVLQPGQSYTDDAPDGAQLTIRFDSTPFGPFPVEIRRVVPTARVSNPNQAGYVSRFVNTTPTSINLQ